MGLSQIKRVGGHLLVVNGSARALTTNDSREGLLGAALRGQDRNLSDASWVLVRACPAKGTQKEEYARFIEVG